MGKADVFTGMSLTEKLIWLKKFSNGGSAPTYEDRTATGNPAIFTTNFAQNAKALSVEFAPKQNLNGFDHPWPAGGGVNKFDIANMGERAGVTISDNTFVGTARSFTASGLVTPFSASEGTVLTVSCTAKSDGVVTSGAGFAIVFLYSDNTMLRPWYTKNSETINTYHVGTVTAEKNITGYRFVDYNNGPDNTWTVKNFQIEIGDTATPYEPYENICPITGVDSIDVVANSVTHEFDLGRTVYGGTLNAKTGVLTIDKIKIPVSDASMMPEGSNGWKTGTNANRIGFAIDTALLPRQNDSLDILCNIGYASDGANSGNGSGFVVGACSLYKGNACMYFRYCVPTSITTVEDAYAFLKAKNCEFTVPLDTPLTYQLTAQEIALLEGENVIATDGDSLNVTYQVKV